MTSVSVDRERCASSGNCAAAYPEVFDQDETDGRVILLEPSPSDLSDDELHEVASMCPARAISVGSGPESESGRRGGSAE